MAKSIICIDDTKCFLCGAYAPLEEHHVFSGYNRKASEKYGLKVKLCHACHNEPPEGVHHNRKNELNLKKYCQRVAMNYYGWSLDDWRQKFSKSWL